MKDIIEFKINDRVRLLRCSEGTNSWQEVGKGAVMGLLTDKGGEQIAIKYRDRECNSVDGGWETIMVKSPRFKVEKI